MEFDLNKSIQVLERTPATLSGLLSGIDEEWTHSNEGPDTFSPFDVMGHLVHGEKTDWIARLNIILSDTGNKTFAPFDRFAQYEESKGKTMRLLLDEFAQLRKVNLNYLTSLKLTGDVFNRTGIHPALGVVTLKHLLSTWAVHDLTHIAQIARVMAKQYKTEVGPWREYLAILKR